MDTRAKLSISFAVAVMLMLAYLGWGEYRGRIDAEEQVVELTADTIRLFGLAVRWERVANRLSQQASDAKSYASTYRTKYDSAVKVSDRNRSGLTYQQQQTAYYQALVRNGTLRPSVRHDTTRIYVSDPDVLSAGLATADREAIGKKALDSMEASIGQREAELKTLRTQRNRAVTSSLRAENRFLKEAETKRFLGIGRRKAARKNAEETRQDREGEAVESDLERVLNQ